MIGELIVHLWKKGGIQALVLLSFMLQVVLLVLADCRKRSRAPTIRPFLWAAYVLADSIAIYILGHLSCTGTSREHELMAFWAPILLLHLGGQDNITAYSLDDCRLWLRHMQTLAVQVAGAVYILYQSSIFVGGGSRSFLLPATILVSVVGLVKYVERVWALWFAGFGASAMTEPGTGRSPIASSFGDSTNATGMLQSAGHPSSFGDSTSSDHDAQGLLREAHRLLDVPKCFFMLLREKDVQVRLEDISRLNAQDMLMVAQMQLELIYDIFYTKAELISRWYGFCARVFTTLAIAMALVLFHLLILGDHHKLDGHRYNRVDVSLTYVLLVGAVILDAVSLLRAALSSWMCAPLTTASSQGVGMGHSASIFYLLGRVIMSLHPPAYLRSIGQSGLSSLGAGRTFSAFSKIVRWIGLEDPWNTAVLSSSRPISGKIIKQLLAEVVLKSGTTASETSPDHILNSRGRAALKRLPLDLNNREIFRKIFDDIELDESILVWHVATVIYLYMYKYESDHHRLDDLVSAVEALSKYMLFLLAARPSMLPLPASRNAFVQLCSDISELGFRSEQELIMLLLDWTSHESFSNETLNMGCELGSHLFGLAHGSSAGRDVILELLAEVWVEILCYASYRCPTYYHAKQLINGWEFITAVALLLEYRRRLDMLGASASGAHTASQEANGHLA